VSFTDILVVTLLSIALFLGLLALFGKIKIVIVYRDEEKPASWPNPDEEEEEVVVNYVKPLETPKPPTLVEAPKRRRGRPQRAEFAKVV
jgi:hypothetical protein